MANIRTQAYLHELNAEYKATRACLERIPESLYNYKPHEKSMNMGYLALLVAEIPLWIHHMVVVGEIDFVTYKHFNLSTAAALLNILMRIWKPHENPFMIPTTKNCRSTFH